MSVRKILSRLASAAALVAVPLPVAYAATPVSGLEGLGASVSDEQLGTMRGKFISPSNVSYFGIQMMTSWQGSDGVTTSATLVFNVDFANGAGNPDGATPQLLVGYGRSGDPEMDLQGFGGAAAGNYVAIALPAGLGGVQGAVQSQQIAGDDNRIQNGMQIAVVPASLVNNMTGNGLTPIQNGQTLQFADGDKLQFLLDSNQLGIGMTDGSDGVSQGFNGDLGQVAQHVLLGSSNNNVTNGMSVVIGFNALEQAGHMNVQNALSAMKSVGF